MPVFGFVFSPCFCRGLVQLVGRRRTEFLHLLFFHFGVFIAEQYAEVTLRVEHGRIDLTLGYRGLLGLVLDRHFQLRDHAVHGQFAFC